MGTDIRNMREAGKKGRFNVSTLLATLVLLAGIGIVAYPTVANWWNNLHQSRALDEYLQAVEDSDPERMERMLSDAEEYNKRLLDKPNRFVMSDEERQEYMGLLNVNGSGIIGYIDIPALHIRYPIYHSTAEDILQVAIGHLEGSSLPVGGKGVHTALSGHRGLPSAVLFSNLDDLQIGDRFTVTVLTRTVTYEVDQIRIVDPEDVSDLKIDPRKDYMTLVTCTPYAINSHRMLVRGIRVADVAMESLTPDATRLSGYVVLIGVALPLLLAYLGVSVVLDRRRRKVPDPHTARKMVTFLHELRKKGESDEDEEE